MTPNNAFNTDSQKRRFAPLLLAGWQFSRNSIRGIRGIAKSGLSDAIACALAG